MLELILKRSAAQGRPIDVNRRRTSNVLKWRVIRTVFQLAVRTGISRSELAMDLGHTEKSTPLHFAARNVSHALSVKPKATLTRLEQGKVRIVRWLLDHGAVDSLYLKNNMGQTPMDLGVFLCSCVYPRVRVFV